MWQIKDGQYVIEKEIDKLNIYEASLNRIIDIRNKLIHGREFYEIDFEKRLQASHDLLAMLDRMILAKLNYNGYFNDCHDPHHEPKRRLMSEIRKNKTKNESA